jgi:hypothetical protein
MLLQRVSASCGQKAERVRDDPSRASEIGRFCEGEEAHSFERCLDAEVCRLPAALSQLFGPAILRGADAMRGRPSDCKGFRQRFVERSNYPQASE